MGQGMKTVIKFAITLNGGENENHGTGEKRIVIFGIEDGRLAACLENKTTDLLGAVTWRERSNIGDPLPPAWAGPVLERLALGKHEVKEIAGVREIDLGTIDIKNPGY